MKKLVVVLMVLLVASLNSFAQKPAVVMSNEPGWHKIGEITANFNMQNESIVVWGADRFAELKLRVTDAPIDIEKVQVIYESGETEDLDVNNQIEAWGESQTLTLKNEDKEIKKVAFTYKTLPNYRGDKAQVELYGYKKGNESDSYRSDRDDNKMNGNDHDSTYRQADKAERDVNNAARRTENDVENAANEAKHETKDGVDKVGDKISEAAGNAAAEVNDQLYSGKMAPGGEKVYIDKNSKYYYINNEGKKVYIAKSQIKDRPKD